MHLDFRVKPENDRKDTFGAAPSLSTAHSHFIANGQLAYVKHGTKQGLPLDIFFNQRYSKKYNGRLAQLVRASGLHPECREFDPLTVQADLKRGPFLF